ncbi:Hypothetical predicted protein, partial [Lynx pardinus]
LQRAHENIWPCLRAIYKAGLTRHLISTGRETGSMSRGTTETYIVVLTTPTALKVDGIATWVHHTHIQPADPSLIRKYFVMRWAISWDQNNPLKLKLQRI